MKKKTDRNPLVLWIFENGISYEVFAARCGFGGGRNPIYLYLSGQRRPPADRIARMCRATRRTGKPIGVSVSVLTAWYDRIRPARGG